MDKLLIYDDEQQLFDAEEIRNALQSCPKITHVRRTPETIAAVEAEYRCAGESAVIRLISTRRMISIEGDLAAMAAVVAHLNQQLARQLHLIDQSYTFDLVIDQQIPAEVVLEKLAEVTE